MGVGLAIDACDAWNAGWALSANTSAVPEISLLEESMKRRDFLKTAGLGAAAATVAKPAIAQSMPELKWRLTSSFPKSLDTLYGASEVFA